MEKMDSLDWKIVERLRTNARLSFKDLAEEVGVSRTAVHQRVQRLFENGIISGTGCHIEPRILGYTTLTYVGIILERGSMYKRVAKKISAIPEVVECHFTTGPYTMLVKLYSKDNAQLMQLLNGGIQEIDGVVSTETLISLEETFSRQIPLPTPEAQ